MNAWKQRDLRILLDLRNKALRRLDDLNREIAEYAAEGVTPTPPTRDVNQIAGEADTENLHKEG